jgi:hypothetical protein
MGIESTSEAWELSAPAEDDPISQIAEYCVTAHRN